MNPSSTSRLSKLAPQIQDLVKQADTQLAGEGITMEVVQGGRSYNEQAALYAQGRQPLDEVNKLRLAVGLAAITERENEYPVTDVGPGESWHNFFMALDCTVFRNSKPVWDVKDAQFLRLVAVMRQVGFTCGYDWVGEDKDSDHFQLTGQFPVEVNDEVRQIFQAYGVEAVWQAAFGGD